MGSKLSSPFAESTFAQAQADIGVLRIGVLKLWFKTTFPAAAPVREAAFVRQLSPLLGRAGEVAALEEHRAAAEARAERRRGRGRVGRRGDAAGGQGEQGLGLGRVGADDVGARQDLLDEDGLARLVEEAAAGGRHDDGVHDNFAAGRRAAQEGGHGARGAGAAEGAGLDGGGRQVGLERGDGGRDVGRGRLEHGLDAGRALGREGRDDRAAARAEAAERAEVGLDAGAGAAVAAGEGPDDRLCWSCGRERVGGAQQKECCR